MKMAPLGLDNLIVVNDEARQAAYETSRKGGGGVDSKSEGGASGQGSKERKWKVGELEFEALMRSLDNAVSFLNIFLLSLSNIDLKNIL